MGRGWAEGGESEPLGTCIYYDLRFLKVDGPWFLEVDAPWFLKVDDLWFLKADYLWFLKTTNNAVLKMFNIFKSSPNDLDGLLGPDQCRAIEAKLNNLKVVAQFVTP